MPVQEYYFSRTPVPRFGKMFFLKRLQEADCSGGGRTLLGSVVQEIREHLTFLGIIAVSEYPVPLHMSVPGIVRAAIENKKKQLGLNEKEPVVLVQKLASSNQTIKIDSKHSYAVGVGPFPSVPAEFGLDIDYSRMQQASLTFGSGTQLEYIPIGYFGMLYKNVKRNHTKVDASGAIGGNNIVDSILLAKNFRVSFLSKEDFDAEFQAKLEAFNSIPGTGNKVVYSKKSKRKIVADISGSKYYLVALGVSDWDDFNLG